MTPIAVRDATAEDAEAIARVARASWAETYRGIFDRERIERFVAENYRPEALAEQAVRAATADDRHFLIAERDGEVIGFAHFGFGDRGPELFRIYADPAHYGSGVGSALLDELHRRLEGRVESYILNVHPDNARGRAFYERNGFVIAGGGTAPDCELMLRRTLAQSSTGMTSEADELRLSEPTNGDG